MDKLNATHALLSAPPRAEPAAAAEVFDFVGRHFLASYLGCDPARLRDLAGLKAAFERAVAASGATLMGSSEHVYPPEGYTLVCMLSESHAAFTLSGAQRLFRGPLHLRPALPAGTLRRRPARLPAPGAQSRPANLIRREEGSGRGAGRARLTCDVIVKDPGARRLEQNNPESAPPRRQASRRRTSRYNRIRPRGLSPRRGRFRIVLLPARLPLGASRSRHRSAARGPPLVLSLFAPD